MATLGTVKLSRGTDIKARPSGSFRLEGHDLTDEDLARLGDWPGVREVDLSGCEEITDAGIRELCKNRGIESVDLSFCNRRTDSALVELAKLPRLRAITLNWCYEVTDAGLEALGTKGTLERVSLWSCEHITDVGIASLSRGGGLRELELPEFAQVTDQSFRLLAERARWLEALRIANLEGFTDLGLAEIAKLPSLRSLIVSHCARIPDRGLAALVAASKLERIRLVACPGIGESGIREFRKDRPHVVVENTAESPQE